MQAATLILVLFIVRFVSAISMAGLYLRLRSRGTALLAAALSVYSAAPALVLISGSDTFSGPGVALLNAVAATLLLLGLLSHFSKPSPRFLLTAAALSVSGAAAGLLLGLPGGIFFGFAIFLAIAGVAVVRNRDAFIRAAGYSYYGALALVAVSFVFYVYRALVPAGIPAASQIVIQIALGAALGLYLLNLEFNISYVALHREQDRYKTLFDAAGDIIMVSSLDGRILDVNQGASERLGYSLDTLRDMRIADVDMPGSAERVLERITTIREQGAAVFESVQKRADGTPLPVEVNARLTEWDGQPAVLGIVRDITERKHNEETIARMAYYDPLTGLANRRLATDRLNQAIARAGRTHELIALLFLDLDQFKSVNDTLGHTVGDGLLIAVADRLSSLVREGDTVARLGGDEFMLIVTGVGTEEATSTVAWKVLDALRTPFTVEDHEIHITASMGISVFQDGSPTALDLLRDADIAMYKAKDRGRNTYQFHDPALNAAALERFQLKADLRRALENDELTLAYQPQVRVEDLRIIGAEVLLRWTHPNLGPISPARFIPLAEEAGLIGEIGRWVMQKGCEQAREWRDAGRPDLRLGVNVSARQFTSFGFIDEVGSILASSGFPAEFLEIEITESIAMRHSEVIGEVFRALDAIGVRIAIDDFGTGHSSLERLGTFPIHTLKVAKPFIDHVGVDDDRSLIARSIILLANSLRLNVIAEGVETEAQLAFLREHECPEMQGYLFSKPVTAEEFGALLEREGSAPTRNQ